jgi:chromosome condensin MukBEF complex kleisin-like MukF subunit
MTDYSTPQTPVNGVSTFAKCESIMSESEKTARDMANTICSFETMLQNQMLLTIRQIVAERRQIEIEEMSKRLQYLNDCLKSM